MKRVALVRDNQITNIIVISDNDELVPGTMLESEAIAQGLKWSPKTDEELAAEKLALYPSTENYQVRAWMIRGGLDPDLVPTIIAQVVPDGPQRKEALMRWDYAVRIPRDFPLVDVIGAQMNLTPEQIDAAWPEILTL